MAVDKLYFENRPDTDLKGLQRAVYEYTKRIKDLIGGSTIAGSGPRLLPDLSIGTTETKVLHGLGRVPNGWEVFSQEDVGIVYETRSPDSQYLYLAAQTSFTPAPTGTYRRFRSDLYNLGATAGPNATFARSGVGLANPQDRLWCFPVTFARAGTITRMAWECQQGGGTDKHWYPFIYRELSTNPKVPGALAYTTLVTVSGSGPSGGAPTQTVTPNVTVSEGETMFFGLLGDTAAFAAAPSSSISPAEVEPLPGLNLVDHGVGVAADYTRAVGYRHAFAFASPPSTYPGSGTPTVIGSSDGTCPVAVFKFTESAAAATGTPLACGIEVF